jgi:cellulose synthase/poly-beta-1,6-N-acetylglucosamine synthase-like glycosyltransferase
LTDLIASSEIPAEIIVVSDGSTDGTAAIARTFADRGVRVLEQAVNQGKAAAINLAAGLARYEILVLADVRQTWSPNAIEHLLTNFSDPSVGAVGGELVLESRSGALHGVGLYWRFEKWLRARESAVHSTVGVSGAICAVRRSLLPSIPAGTILDDVYWPLCIAMQGYRTVHEQRACAFDVLPERATDEFRRKVRTLSGNFQLVQRLPAALSPWHNPVSWQLCSHKLIRLGVPWALVAMFITSAALPEPVYLFAFWAEACFFGLALVGILSARVRRLKPASVAASFTILNAAAWCAFWVWIFGRAAHSWHKTIYLDEPAPVSEQLA